MIPQDKRIDGFIANPLPKILFGIGGLSVIVSIIIASTSEANFYRFYFSYLNSFAFFLSISLGAMFFVLISFVTFSGWNVVVRRIAEHFMKSIWVIILFGIPVLFFGSGHLFHWLHPHSDDAILLKKLPYLNMPFFIIRSLIYFIVWYWISNYFFKKSVIQDIDGDKVHTLNMQKTSNYSMFLFAGTLTFAAFDYLMSLEPHWYSTIFGVYYFSGSAVGFFALLGISISILRRKGYLVNVVNKEHYHDIGKLMFGFNIFWAYIAFSQYFLIWYGNIPEETLWYMDRQTGGWLNVTIFLVIGHLVVPFIFFMSRNMKRNVTISSFFYLWMLGMHLVDIYYIVMPTAGKHHGEVHFYVSPLDVLWVLGIGGVYFGVTLMRMKKFALFPIKDPRLSESLTFENV